MSCNKCGTTAAAAAVVPTTSARLSPVGAPAAGQLSVNFSVAEFQRASTRVLTSADLPMMEYWTGNHLQPARRELGRLRITSYIRDTDTGRAHENGGGVDVVPLDVSIDEAFEWMTRNLAPRLGRIIHERDHIHLARPGGEPWAGQGVVLIEPVEGVYQFATVLPATFVAPIAELIGVPFSQLAGRQPTAIESAVLILIVVGVSWAVFSKLRQG